MVLSRRRILVAGAGGFIGQYLVTRLKAGGHWVRGADIRPPTAGKTDADDFQLLDLRRADACLHACEGGIDWVFQLAADMGGIGYITGSHAAIARNNTLINAHMLEAARQHDVKLFLFSSSACVYAQSKQRNSEPAPLKEDDAYPADPEAGYGWEKLYAEELCKYYRQDYGLDTSVVRFHNVYGPLSDYEGGREKAPAAICRKIALATDGGEVEIWGDGNQSRSFLYIDDCVEGLVRLVAGHDERPVNLGSSESLTVNQLTDLIANIAGKRIVKRYSLDRPQGVRGRNSDNSRLLSLVGWQPAVSLREGLTLTYRWIEAELRKANRLPRSQPTAAAR